MNIDEAASNIGQLITNTPMVQSDRNKLKSDLAFLVAQIRIGKIGVFTSKTAFIAELHKQIEFVESLEGEDELNG